MILNQSQAEAVYSAMCALNNVGGRVSVIFSPQDSEEISVFERTDGIVSVWQRNHGQVHNDETHTSQAAFATAYGLNSDEPQSAVAAAAGGLTQTAIER